MALKGQCPLTLKGLKALFPSLLGGCCPLGPPPSAAGCSELRVAACTPATMYADMVTISCYDPAVTLTVSADLYPGSAYCGPTGASAAHTVSGTLSRSGYIG